MTLIADIEPQDPDAPPPPRDLQIAKVATGLIVVTPGYTVNGNVFTPPGAHLDVFVESPSPPFVPMTDVHTRSLADRRIRGHYHTIARTRVNGSSYSRRVRVYNSGRYRAFVSPTDGSHVWGKRTRILHVHR